MTSSSQPSVCASGHRVGLHLLRHLLGTVVGQAETHDGQHHGNLIDGTVLRLRLHLACHLPLWRGTKRNEDDLLENCTRLKSCPNNINQANKRIF